VPQGRPRHQFVSLGTPSLEVWNASKRSRKLIGTLVTLRATPGARRQIAFIGYLGRLQRMALARIDGRIEEHQRIPTRPILQGMHNRGYRRKGMEDPGCRLCTPLIPDRSPDALVIPDEISPVMVNRMMRWVLAVIAEIVKDKVVSIEQQPPE